MTFEEWWKERILKEIKPSHGEQIERWETADKIAARDAWEAGRKEGFQAGYDNGRDEAIEMYEKL